MNLITKNLGLLLLSGWSAFARPASGPNIGPQLEGYNVSWDMPGPTAAQSMPLGNGDIGLNVWAETNGAVAFYIGKTDSWGPDVHGDQGLMKVGGVRIALNPSPLVTEAPFLQVLKLREGEIEIREGAEPNQSVVRVWVDANHPVIRVEATSAKPVVLEASLINWRLSGDNPDIVLTNKPDQVAWYHRNPAGANSNVANLTFGAIFKGADFTSASSTNLVSAAKKSHLISIYPYTAKAATAGEWQAQLEAQVKKIEALNLEQTRKAHREWWDQFWHRSWVYVDGDFAATTVTRGYILQRFITACGGRGAYPMKFNGSLFVVEDPAKNHNPDHRDWGGQYWFQNTRPMYWPRLAAGDFDIMLPLFKMYQGQLAPNAAQVNEHYRHGGSYFAETAPYWGGLKYWGPEVKEDWTGHYFTPILELSMMMLDYYEFTGDAEFARNTLLPVTTAGLQFFDEHFPRDEQGKILLDPDNSIEMYWKVRNPAPDIAGLHAIVSCMLALPDTLVEASLRARWHSMQKQLPELPIGETKGRRVILPYAGEQTAKQRNGENPELYTIYPFRLYGLEKPDLQLAIDTFKARKMTQKGCWVQDPIQAAMIGLADVARSYVSFNFGRREGRLKFPAFWAKANDYPPDLDNGGNGEHGLQQMLMQTEGQKILLLPAWPQGWNASFRLHAPFQTTVTARVQDGKLTDLVVDPPSRKADVIDMSTRVTAPAEAAAPTAAVRLTAVPGFKGSVKNILSPQDAIVPLKQTRKGRPNVLATIGDFGGDGSGEQAPAVIDGNVNSKYFSKGSEGDGAPPGVNTGFAITPAAGGSPVTAVQVATANDMRDRDPLSITIEGSNDANAVQAQGGGYTLIYQGSTGLENDPGRNAWGPAIAFTNATTYKTYRVLVTAVRSDSDATQYGEIRLGTAEADK